MSAPTWPAMQGSTKMRALGWTPSRSISVAQMRDRPVGREREGRAAELGRIDAEQQMMHDRIADEGDLEDLARVDAGFLGRDLLREAR